MVSKLYLDIPETSNPKTIRVLDSSLYNEDINISCSRLEITPPGFDYPIVIEVTPYFNLALNTSTLGLEKVSKYSDLSDLPDGVYTFRYSIAPNDKVWVEYEYLRTQQLSNRYLTQYCKAKLSNLDPNRDQNKKLRQILDIRQMIDAAKAEVEFCGNRDKGLEIYDFAAKNLSRLETGGCINC
jgi:hypothetical protein